jgi:hypothetical protein
MEVQRADICHMFCTQINEVPFDFNNSISEVVSLELYIQCHAE